MPLPGTHARIVDWNTGQPLPINEVGELIIHGPQIMQGYWNMPKETAQALHDGWLHTGDLARMDEDGFFTLVDRKKDLILYGPYNVYPRDVEEVLYEYPKVLEAAVVCIPASPVAAVGIAPAISPGEGIEINEAKAQGEMQNAPHLVQTLPHNDSPYIKAVVVLKPGERATANELLTFCSERLDAYKVPQRIEFRSELPKNSVGKVLRRLLIE